MELRINGHILSIGQLGPDFLILDDPIDCPPTAGEITVSIDGDLRRWPVHLPEGIEPAQLRTRFADRPALNGSTVH